MQVFYNLLKSSHHTNAASLAENSRLMTDTTRALTNLASRVDELTSRVTVAEQNHRVLNERLNADLAVVRSDISRIDAANREPRIQRSLEDSLEIVRGIPLAVQLEPLQLAATPLTALKLLQHAPLVVGWRAWNVRCVLMQSKQSPLLPLSCACLLPLFVHSFTRLLALRFVTTFFGRLRA